MEITTPRSHYKTFYLILLGVIIILSAGVYYGKRNSFPLLLLAVPMVLPFMFVNVILSIDIIDDQLVLKKMNFFKKKTIFFNIREVELQLFFTPGERRRRSEFYSMYIVKRGQKLHEMRHGVAELSTFIAHFNSKKASI